jgi:hypothetical protein
VVAHRGALNGVGKARVAHHMQEVALVGVLVVVAKPSRFQAAAHVVVVALHPLGGCLRKTIRCAGALRHISYKVTEEPKKLPKNRPQLAAQNKTKMVQIDQPFSELTKHEICPDQTRYCS